MTDVFDVQDEIAAAVVDGLKIHLMGEVPKTRTADPAAYTLFMQAREIRRQYTSTAFERSMALYQQALQFDPMYAAAWTGLAGLYCDQFLEGLRSADESIQLAREATTKALALEPQFAPGHARLGWIALHHDGDLAGAARHIERALTLEPGNTDILGTAAALARRLGRFNQAAAISEYISPVPG